MQERGHPVGTYLSKSESAQEPDEPKNISTFDSIFPFERIRRTNAAGFEHWSSRDFASILGYTDYRNFESVIGKARLSCFNSGHRIEDHFVDITEMVAIGCPLK